MHFLRLPFAIVACSVAILFLCRLILLVSYPAYFAELSLSDLLVAFVSGIRFDLSVSVISQALVLLLLLVPSRFIHNRRMLSVLASLSLLVMLAITGIALADISYFSEVHRHMGSEITRLGDDFGAIVDVALESRLLQTLAAVVFLVFVSVLGFRVLIKPVREQAVVLSSSYWRRGLAAGIGFFALLLMGRGLVPQGKPLDIVDAFSSGSQVQANLTLSGPFVVFNETRSSEKKILSYLELSEFNSLDQAQFAPPFRVTTRAGKKKNVVFILLESWSYKYIDALAGNNYRVTPFMDQLVEKSVVWDNFYAAGQRSILGIQAVLSSVPVLPTQPVLGYGLELHNFSRLAKEAGDEGFRTLMVQSSNRRSFHMDGIASSLGFSEYYGKEDMPVIRDYPQDIPRFGWDYETLMFTKEQIDRDYQKEEPFFAFVFTGTTHEPFADPGEEFHVYPHSSSEEEGFLNTVRYSDWSIEQFMTEAEKQPWFKDTVFVFSADHVLRAETDNLKDKFHIPLVVYSPDGSLPPERRQDVASQYDLMPSLLELMGVEASVSSFGRSLWSENRPDNVYVSQGSIAGYISEEVDVPFTEKHLMNASPLSMEHQKQVKLLQWRLQKADYLLKRNRWVETEKESVSASR